VNEIPLACSLLAYGLKPKGIDMVVHGNLIHCRTTKPTPFPIFPPADLQLLLQSSLFATCPMNLPNTPGPMAPPAKGDGSMSTHLNRALAFLRSAGTLASAARAVSASLVGFFA
jgi:hypothetical protein